MPHRFAFLLRDYERVVSAPGGVSVLRTRILFLAAEYEFYQFRAPKGQGAGYDDHNSSATARFLRDNVPHALPHLTEGMMGYSLTDPQRNQEWYYDIFNTCDKFRCGIEGWHTESGPGVFEAVRQRPMTGERPSR